MLNIIRNIVRRYWMFFLMMLVFAVISFITVDDRAAIAVLLYTSLLTMLATDLKAIMYECSLPVDRKKVVDARFLLIFVLLVLIAVIFTPMTMKYEQLSRFAPVLALTFLSTSVWMMYAFCFGKGQLNLLMGIVMTLLLLFMLLISVNKTLTLETTECFFLMGAGFAIYVILWLVSRNRIGKGDF